MLSERRKLLLADDSPTIQKVISLTFEDEGLEVVTVGDGQKALRALEADDPPDILLADVLMPGPNGYELCERVKGDRRLSHVPVVLLVGSFESFNEAEARRVGADTVLTKPFQSIRDMVSKVGSLLGGSKHEEPASEAQPREASHEEVAAAHAETATRAQAAEPSAEHGEAFYSEANSSFADLGADDELIEAKPADAFGSAQPQVAARAERADAPTRAQASHEWQQVNESRPSEAHEPPRPFAESHAPAAPYGRNYETPEREAFTMNGHSHAAHEERPSASFAGANEFAHVSQPEERKMPAQTPLNARAASASAASASADDSLLDLGQTAQPAGVAVAEDDDFILDLGDDAPAFPSTGGGAVLEAAALGEPQPATTEKADAPSAFAEASHGEQSWSFAEPPQAFDEPAASYHEPPRHFSEHATSSSESATAYEPFEVSSPNVSAFEDATAAEVVMQDEPQPSESHPLGSRAAHYDVGEAPRGFVEPEVVPADAPAHAVVEGEYTDGSVEGDVAKAPAGVPSTAGYVVGESRTGVEEQPGAGGLSQEQVDRIARRVVELMSDRVVREIAWEVVPELAELLIKQRLDEERQK